MDALGGEAPLRGITPTARLLSDRLARAFWLDHRLEQLEARVERIEAAERRRVRDNEQRRERRRRAST